MIRRRYTRRASLRLHNRSGKAGYEGGKIFLSGFLNAFPDARFTIDDMIAEGDQVVTKKSFAGTHKDEFFGIPATGNSVTLRFVDMRL